jgi:uncharacterized protein YrrD
MTPHIGWDQNATMMKTRTTQEGASIVGTTKVYARISPGEQSGYEVTSFVLSNLVYTCRI